MGYKWILKLDPTILSLIKERVVNHPKSSDWAQNLKVKDRDQNKADSHKVLRWKIGIELMMDQDQKCRGSWIRMGKYPYPD